MDILPALGDLGYEGESDTITLAFKKPKGGELTDDQKAHNKSLNGKRAVESVVDVRAMPRESVESAIVTNRLTGLRFSCGGRTPAGP